jgi:HSP20 family protein
MFRDLESIAENFYGVSKNKDGSTSIIIEIPGCEKEDVKIKVSAGKLTITGESKIINRKYSKVYYISPTVDKSKIKSILKAGVLTINLVEKTQDESEIAVEVA